MNLIAAEFTSSVLVLAVHVLGSGNKLWFHRLTLRACSYSRRVPSPRRSLLQPFEVLWRMKWSLPALFFVLRVVDANTAERDALVALYDATGGSGWHHNGGWLDGDPCSWYGVTCDGSGSVTQL